MKGRYELSSGGVIYRQGDAGPDICLINTQGGKTWQLPKGIIEDGEPPEDAALREVLEETGLQGEIVKLLDKIEYWYVDTYTGPGRIRVHKNVYFFLMRYLSGTTDDHDDESEEARWFTLADAQKRVSFGNERNVLDLAATAIDEAVNG
ncbi:MAG: NUDIX hydrolase [Dehalococcoidia bacterium]